jgi:outer membrane protein assembly factor BamA
MSTPLPRFQILPVAAILAFCWLVADAAEVRAEPQGAAPAQGAVQELPRSRQIIPFPVLLSDPTNGFGGGGGLLMLYGLNETAAKDSETAAFGYYTTTSSWKWGLRQGLSFGEDRFRSTTTGIFGNTNNSFAYTNLPLPVAYGERQDRIETDFKVNVFDNLYAGVAYRYARTDFRFDVGTEAEQAFSRVVLGISGAENTTDSGIGVVVEFDNRDQEYSPNRGILGSFRLLDQSSWLGSDNDYRSADASFNYYRTVAPGHLLAFRFRWRDTWGDVPFTGESTFSGVDLRAYPGGKYRGAGMLAAQLEYRFNAWKRVGGVVFGGSGRVYGGEPTLGADQVLPSGGAGIRFLLLKERGTQVGLDFAQGRSGNRGVYFFFDEAF